MEKIKWGNRSFSADASKVASEIESIGESAKPEQIVNYAKKHKNSELYKCFTWDNDKAAEQYRLYEARMIVRNLIIEQVEEDADEEKLRYRVFYRTSTDNEAGYEPVKKIVVNKEKSLGMLEVAKQELYAFKRKYEVLTKLVPEINPVMTAINDFLGKEV